jgi:hypothetical protein
VGINNLNGRHGDDPFSGLIGTYYALAENIILDAALEIGMNKAAPDYRVTAGFTWLFKPRSFLSPNDCPLSSLSKKNQQYCFESDLTDAESV